MTDPQKSVSRPSDLPCTGPLVIDHGPDTEVLTCRDNMCGNCDVAIRLLERKAIVAWLREPLNFYALGTRAEVLRLGLADEIEKERHHG